MSAELHELAQTTAASPFSCIQINQSCVQLDDNETGTRVGCKQNHNQYIHKVLKVQSVYNLGYQHQQCATSTSKA
jgi:hypothetical protein